MPINQIQRAKGKWKCSCGFKISMNILEVNAGNIGDAILEKVLAPHRKPGHQLTEIKPTKEKVKKEI
jgi:hypothetical protein